MTAEQERKLALEYLPELYFDKNEPFSLIRVGYTIFEESGKSPSARRQILLDKGAETVCIEYAFYYDYDIQHLYDLEHVWVYIDRDGKICGCESSFHGMYLNSMLPGADILRETGKIHLYVQPGKHAFMPDPRLFALHREFMESCGDRAGADGVLCPDIIPGMPSCTKEDDEMVRKYICEKYSFVPSGKYEFKETDGKLLRPWSEVCAEIPGRITGELEKIRNSGTI